MVSESYREIDECAAVLYACPGHDAASVSLCQNGIANT